MADIDIPGIGPVKDVYVYGGVAAGAAILAYAWWRKKTTPEPDYVGASPDDYGATDYDSPLGNTGTNSTGNYTSVDPDAIDTNAKWTVAAVEKLSDWGWDASSVGIALGKYLARLGLSELQIEIVNTAVGALGPPPVGGPYPIKPALPDTPSTGDPDPDPPATEKLPKPEGFRQIQAWPDALMVGWTQVPGATEYVIDEVSANRYPSNVRVPAGQYQTMLRGLVPQGSYHLTIAAVDSQGRKGHTNYMVAHTTKTGTQ